MLYGLLTQSSLLLQGRDGGLRSCERIYGFDGGTSDPFTDGQRRRPCLRPLERYFH